MHDPASITIDGPDASRALEELLAIPGVEGRRVTPHPTDGIRDAGLVQAIAETVGIVGGIAGIATAIIDWREKWLKGRGGERMSAEIVDARGNRLLLTEATPEQLTQALQSLAAVKPE